MHEKTIANPYGALRQTSDFRTGKYDDGTALDLPALVMGRGEVQASAAIVRGAPVMWAVATATVPFRVVTATAAAASGYLVIGLTNNAPPAAGSPVELTIMGFCLANAGTTAPAFGDWGALTANAGEVGKTTAGPAATDIVGSVLGIFLGAKDANNLAPFWVNHF